MSQSSGARRTSVTPAYSDLRPMYSLQSPYAIVEPRAVGTRPTGLARFAVVMTMVASIQMSLAERTCEGALA
jgi:hypothetical protein